MSIPRLKKYHAGFRTACYSGSKGANSSADADALDANGMRYQIKCRKLETPAGSRQLGFIRRLPDRPFDHLAAVLFDGKFRVLRGALIPYEVVELRATYVDSVEAWRFKPDSNVQTPFHGSPGSR
jgi:hypothetical protein